jgi:hypothetical protein
MEPTFSEGDLVVVREGSYEIGDVVAFETGNGLVIHRIVGGTPESGFVMQGDNKPAVDSWTPGPEQIMGEQFARVPNAGRWLHSLAANPAWFGAMIGGLGSLLVWSPQRRRRRGAHRAETSTRRSQGVATRVAPRGAGTTLLVIACVVLLLGGLTTWLMLRPLERVETFDRVVVEHQGEFGYTATVRPSVVYDTDKVESPASGSVPTAIYTQLLEELMIGFDYEAQAPSEVAGTIASELKVGAGEGLWARTIPLHDPVSFQGGGASVSFPVDVARLVAMVARAEEETGHIPGLYDVTVVTTVRVRTMDDTAGFRAELPMQLRGTLLTVDNEGLTMEETSTETAERTVPNDIEVLGLAIPMRWARASAGGLAALVLLGGLVYWLAVRRRLGRGELARIRLRYGSMIVPVTGETPNGSRPVEVGSMSDLVRLARRAEQMVFYAEVDPAHYRFFVPDGSLTYVYEMTGS